MPTEHQKYLEEQYQKFMEDRQKKKKEEQERNRPPPPPKGISPKELGMKRSTDSKVPVNEQVSNFYNSLWNQAITFFLRQG
jgi:hypothetical protein